jgi:DNA-directed RNA polymerase subunit L
MDSWEVHNSGLLVDVPRLTALNTRIKLGRDVDPVEFLTAVEQMIDTMNEVKSHLEQLEPRLEGSLSAHT